MVAGFRRGHWRSGGPVNRGPVYGRLVDGRPVNRRWRRAGLGCASRLRASLLRTGLLDAGLMSTSFLLRFNLGFLEGVVVVSVVDVATTLALSDSTRAAFELALDVQEVHHVLSSNSTTTLENKLLLNLFQQILIHLDRRKFGCNFRCRLLAFSNRPTLRQSLSLRGRGFGDISVVFRCG
jgi:hypothetical protein